MALKSPLISQGLGKLAWMSHSSCQQAVFIFKSIGPWTAVKHQVLLCKPCRGNREGKSYVPIRNKEDTFNGAICLTINPRVHKSFQNRA